MSWGVINGLGERVREALRKAKGVDKEFRNILCPPSLSLFACLLLILSGGFL